MNRNDKEYRRTKKRLSELEEELQRLSSVGRSARQDEVASAVSDTLRMQIEDQPPLREPRDLHQRAGRGLGRLLRARRLVGALEERSVLEEITGRRRNRVYAAREILQVLQGPWKTSNRRLRQ